MFFASRQAVVPVAGETGRARAMIRIPDWMEGPGRRRAAVVVFVVAMLGACNHHSAQGAKGIGLLAPAPTSDAELNLSSYQPPSPYTQIAPGLLGRTVYNAEG